MGAIDCHIHHYPDAARQDPMQWARERGEAHWAELVTSLAGKRPLQGWASAAQLQADMQTAGVDMAVMQGWYWEKQATCREHNRFMAERCAASDRRLRFFATVQPAEGEACLRDLEEAIGNGAAGIGELFPMAQGYAMDDPVFAQVLALAEARKLPVLLHVTEPLGHLYKGKIIAPLMDYQELITRHPQVTFILAHWGGGLPFFELNPYVRELFRNVYYDTSASPLLYREDVWRSVVDLVGAEKILYGSDYPLRLYPRKQPDPSFLPLLEEIEQAPLTDSERKAILSGNAAKLLSH